MKRLFAAMALSAAILLLSGCYVDPGYSYVRRTGYQGDAYYGEQVRDYDGGYYAVPSYGPYYGGGYGCCYAPGVSLGVSAAWYGRARYYREQPRYHRYGNDRGYRGGWRGGSNRGDTHPRDTHPRRADRRNSGHRVNPGGRPQQ